MLGQLFGPGMTAAYCVFLLPIAEDFDASMSQMSLGMLIFILVTCLVSPVIGAWIKAGRTRTFMLCGAIAMMVSMAALAFAGSLLWLGLAMAALSTAFAMYGAIPSTIIITRCYNQQRGRALAVMAMGISFAGFILPPLCAWLLEQLGWRMGLLTLGLGSGVILLACFSRWLTEQTAPGDALREAGIVGNAGTVTQTPIAEHRADAGDSAEPSLLKDRYFWLIGALYGIINTTLILSGIYLIPFLQTLGLGAVEAASVIAIGGVSGLFGKILIGWLLDSMQNRAVLILLALECSLIACWHTLSTAQAYSSWVFVILAMIGFAQGGTIPLQPYINGLVFGAERVGKVTGFHALFLLPFVAPAAPLAGYYVDTHASYSIVFLGCMGLVIAAFTLTLLVCVVRAKPAGSA
jgi:predicted MFS family arabinose efflux permease